MAIERRLPAHAYAQLATPSMTVMIPIYYVLYYGYLLPRTDRLAVTEEWTDKRKGIQYGSSIPT